MNVIYKAGLPVGTGLKDKKGAAGREIGRKKLKNETGNFKEPASESGHYRIERKARA
jgi:hypothetical protein